MSDIRERLARASESERRAERHWPADHFEDDIRVVEVGTERVTA